MSKYKKKVKLGEKIFSSFQGEALHSGVPSIWIRFFQCNLQCDGFNQSEPTKPETYELPYKTVDISNITKMEDLPVFEKCCDSSYSWSKKFRHLCPEYTVEELVDEIIKLGINNLSMMENEFIHHKTYQPVMLCFTGGEPLLQQDIIIDIFKELEYRGIVKPRLVTIETNATIKLKDIFKTLLKKQPIHFACSPKLYNTSGEKNKVDINTIIDYTKYTNSLILKFVVNGSQASWDELEEYVSKLRYLNLPIYCMPIGATLEQQNNIADLVTETLKRGYIVATRNHVYIFGNKLGT